MNKLEETFTKDLITRTQKAMALGANGKRLLSQLEKDGGVRVMQNLIRRQQVSDVFDGLEKAGQLALSPEGCLWVAVYR